MNRVTRRNVLKAGSLTAAGLFFSGFSLPAWAQRNDDHFYLQFVIEGGWDPTYLFDARPLEMTQNKVLQNYHGVAPIRVKGANGGECWRTDITNPLMKHFDSFSILNGVVMASGFDGHGQNMNYLFTGNPFGGVSFLPHLAKKGKYTETSIVGIESGSIFVEANNHGEIVPLAGEAGKRLIQFLKANPMVDINEPGFAFTRERFLANSQTGGKFSKTNKALIHSMDKQEQLYNQFKGITFSNGGQDPIQQNVELMKNVFSQKVARLATIRIMPESGDPNEFLNVDTHFFEDAQKQTKLYKSVVEQISSYLTQMRNISYDSQRSLLDVTTFMVGSEFSRTMQQKYTTFDQTGTDHNSLTNSLIVGGKGIKAGQVVGMSDYQTSSEVLSKAHLSKDPDSIKMMGAPFDHDNQRPSGLMPDHFEIENYLNAQSVANTMMELFGVPAQYHWKLNNSGGLGPVLKALI